MGGANPARCSGEGQSSEGCATCDAGFPAPSKDELQDTGAVVTGARRLPPALSVSDLNMTFERLAAS